MAEKVSPMSDEVKKFPLEILLPNKSKENEQLINTIKRVVISTLENRRQMGLLFDAKREILIPEDKVDDIRIALFDILKKHNLDFIKDSGMLFIQKSDVIEEDDDDDKTWTTRAEWSDFYKKEAERKAFLRERSRRESCKKNTG